MMRRFETLYGWCFYVVNCLWWAVIFGLEGLVKIDTDAAGVCEHYRTIEDDAADSIAGSRLGRSRRR